MFVICDQLQLHFLRNSCGSIYHRKKKKFKGNIKKSFEPGCLLNNLKNLNLNHQLRQAIFGFVYMFQ